MSTKPKKCPLCSKSERSEFAPFCSNACKSRDLLKWLGEGYRIPGPTAPPDGLDSDGGEG